MTVKAWAVKDGRTFITNGRENYSFHSRPAMLFLRKQDAEAFIEGSGLDNPEAVEVEVEL